jgi:hypothetical protein
MSKQQRVTAHAGRAQGLRNMSSDPDAIVAPRCCGFSVDFAVQLSNVTSFVLSFLLLLLLFSILLPSSKPRIANTTAHRHVYILDMCALLAADHVKTALLQACKTATPTTTPHVTIADAGIEKQRLCIYTAARTVPAILDAAVAADYCCFVVHVSTGPN